MYLLKDEQQSVAFGEALSKVLARGGIVYLRGTLGAGKTTTTRGILRGFGHQGAVKSPTYTLVEPYEFADRKVFHFDLYRLGDPEELEYMGIRDYFTESNVCIVEWPSKGEGFLPAADLEVIFEVCDQGRLATVKAISQRGQTLLGDLNYH